jgi:hypothetical protein
LQSDLAEVNRHQNGGDYPAACRGVMRMMGRLLEAPARMQAHWTMIDSIYTAEAARRGVTLPR